MYPLAYTVLFENDMLLAVDKPSSILTVVARQADYPSLYDTLRTHYPSLKIVHRLDRDTSGVVLFAKGEYVQNKLSTLFAKRQMKKTYLALVRNSLMEKQKTISLPLEVLSTHTRVNARGKEAQTDVEVAESFLHYTLLYAYPKTGRTHQIRVHLSAIACPIVGDSLYGEGHCIYLSMLKKKYKPSKLKPERPLLKRLALHAHRLSFTWEGRNVEIMSPIPSDFAVALRQLRKYDQ